MDAKAGRAGGLVLGFVGGRGKSERRWEPGAWPVAPKNACDLLDADFGGGMIVLPEATLEIVCENETVRRRGIGPLPNPRKCEASKLRVGEVERSRGGVEIWESKTSYGDGGADSRDDRTRSDREGGAQ